ncbi:putative transcriptional regulator [Carnobacterium sp. 17-4]|uniref:AraC family transcriptional regulator n=1 Tax=Carnobacterium sp. (strain 17-4) TaxID=208596 RepID=UPI0002058E0D|nr:AraC family transcriptional regulator [Carnobacterium sp. 17-4]AEB30792.1 putative transcriptional regulator [Carnobacterium sp. 17-4]
MKGYSKKSRKMDYQLSLVAFSHVKGQVAELEFHSHQQYELYFFHGGECKYLINNQIYDLNPGDMLFLDGLDLHKAHVTGNKELYERSMIHFSPEWILPVLKELDALFLFDAFKQLRHGLFHTQVTEESCEIEELITKLSRLSQTTEVNMEIAAEAEAKILLIQLLFKVHQLDKTTLVELNEVKNGKYLYAEKIASYLQKHFKEIISIEDISKELNLSSSYISHTFKYSTGYTVMQYLMEYRLIQAKYLIEVVGENKTIKDISRECGFESDAHFNRFFKKKIGATPNEYRKKQLDKYRKKIGE